MGATHNSYDGAAQRRRLRNDQSKNNKWMADVKEEDEDEDAVADDEPKGGEADKDSDFADLMDDVAAVVPDAASSVS